MRACTPGPRRALAVLPCLLAASCSYTISMRGVGDALRADEVRTVVIEKSFTLVSPYPVDRTVKFARQIEKNMAEVSRLLEVSFDEPILAVLIPVEMEALRTDVDGDGVSIHGAFRHPTVHGVRGFAGARGDGEGPTLNVIVARDRQQVLEDGRVVTLTFNFDHEPTIRHEMTHLCAYRAGFDGPTWFDEGLAFEVETMAWQDGELRRSPLPETLLVARRIHHDWSLDVVLAWDERAGRVIQGEPAFRQGRPLAHSLMRFLLLRVPGESLRQGLERVAAMREDEILALEDAWRDWLDALR